MFRKRRCPPGVVCIENVTFFALLCCVCVIGYSLYILTLSWKSSQQNTITNTLYKTIDPRKETDVLLNPYTPPIKDEGYWNRNRNFRYNEQTNVGAISNAPFRQVGYLLGDTNTPIALMGRPLFANRDKWQYYSMSDQFNSIKLPLLVKGKKAMNEYGCDKLYSDDEVGVDGMKNKYKVTLYES